jgi:hypothetical protein
MNCLQIGQWITDNVEKPIQQWFANALKQCTQAVTWLEQVETDIETWLHQQIRQCLEQPCNWLCLCCNKWFCWILEIVSLVITAVIQTIVHVIQAVCRLILTVLFLVVMLLVQITKWVVQSIFCLLESLCSLFVLAGALALLVLLLCIAVLPVSALAPLAMAAIPVLAIVAIVALALANRLCDASRCRILGVIGWALKWAIVLGAVGAIVLASPLTALIVVVYGGLIATLILICEKVQCALPRMLGLP